MYVGDIFYYFNYLEIYPSEITLPLLMVVLSAFLVSCVVYFSRWPKLYASKLLSTVALAFMLNNYDVRLGFISGFFRGIVPALPPADGDLPIISVLFFVILVAISIFIGLLADKILRRSKRKDASNKFAEFLLVFVVVIGLWQVIHLATILPTISKQSKSQPVSLGKTSKPTSDKPDIYYIVLDRYTNETVLKDQFAYDNSNFINNLRQMNFNVNEYAYSNYPVTSMSISSTLNANYTNNIVSKYKNDQIQSRTLYHNLIRQSSVAKALKDNGYKFYQIGADYSASSKAPMADVDLTSSNSLSVFNSPTRKLTPFEYMEFNKSIYRQLFKVTFNWWPFKSIEKDKVKMVGEQLSALNSLASQKSRGKFVFAHILVPHHPYVFNSDGSISQFQTSDNYGTTIKTKYLNQLQYINTEISKTIKNIMETSDGQAVIILNADEGTYPQEMNSDAFDLAAPLDYMSKTDMNTWSEKWLKMKFGILQATYIPKASQQDVQNLSSVNMFRIILNNYLGYKLEYLPNCNFGFNRGDRYEYDYSDITKKLQSNPNQECQQYQSLK